MPVPQQEKKQSEPAAHYPQLSKLSNAEHWKRSLNPDYVGPTEWREVKEGVGEGAVCGGEITLKLRGLNSAEQEKTIRLGNAPYAVLDTALLGMKPGAVREVIAPTKDIKKSSSAKGMIRFEVERVDGVEPTTATPSF